MCDPTPINHYKEAATTLSTIALLEPDLSVKDQLRVAGVHSNLAIAEELKGIRHQLEEGAIEVMYDGRTV